MTKLKRWKLKPQQKTDSEQLGQSLSVSPILAQLLINRNIKSVEDAQRYLSLSNNPSQFNSNHLRGILAIILDTIERKRPILVYGDYDVDGMSSTAMMVKLITQLGGIVRYKIPHRFNDGYGLSSSIIELLQLEQIDLLLTLDCGITNIAEVSLIKERCNTKVVIFDHHTIPKQVPPADAILNPKALDPKHPLYDLCTAGIVYQFVCFVADHYENINPKHFVDLAALATVADVVNLQGENRRIVKEGLLKFSDLQHPGFKALIKVANIKKEIINEQDFGFLIAPRLNASGRLSTAHHGVELLLSNNDNEAYQRAMTLERLNQNRKQLDQDILEQAIQEIEGNDHYKKQSILVLGNEDWHAGVIGITASKLVDRYSKPVVIVSFQEDVGRGSSRSLGDINIYNLLFKCKDLFTKFGGHSQAAGFSIEKNKFNDLRSRLEQESAKEINQEALYDSLTIDAKLNSDHFTLDFIQDIYSLSPFGHGNEEPLFYTDQLHIIDSKVVGNGKHLKLSCQDLQSKKIFDAIGFNLASKLPLVYKKENHLAFHLSKNSWNGRTSIQLILKDIK